MIWTISVSRNGKAYGIEYEVSGDSATLVRVPTDYEGVFSIPEYVQRDGRIRNVTAVGSRAFADCKELTKVRIPYTVRHVADDAFVGCDSLEDVDSENVSTCNAGTRDADDEAMFRERILRKVEHIDSVMTMIEYLIIIGVGLGILNCIAMLV